MPVTDSIKKAHPQANVAEAEKIFKPDGSVSGYEVEFKDGGKSLEIHLDQNGKMLKTEVEK